MKILPALVSLAIAPGVSLANGSFIELPEQINIVALGVGQYPDYSGSDDYNTSAAPYGRYYFSGDRYVQLLGPQVTVNLLEDDSWQFGPEVLYRFGRDNDVDDNIVRQMNEIDDTMMVGAFVAYSIKDTGNPLKRWVFSADLLTDVNDTNDGIFGTAMVKYWFPVGSGPAPTLINISAGISFADDDYNNTYYGVSGSDTALLPAYTADGGMNSWRVMVGGVKPLSKFWMVGTGAYYEALLGDPSDSPVVAQRGDSSQWIYGIAIGYTWE